jgi:hypothetical protein
LTRPGYLHHPLTCSRRQTLHSFYP